MPTCPCDQGAPNTPPLHVGRRGTPKVPRVVMFGLLASALVLGVLLLVLVLVLALTLVLVLVLAWVLVLVLV